MKRAKLIALTGIDGSGKTTQAKLILESLREKEINVSYVWCRWNPLLLRPLLKIWSKKTKNNTNKSLFSYSNKMKYKKTIFNNIILRSTWLILFFIDYGFQILFKIRITSFTKKFIVSDRYYYDSIIDQAINLEKRKDKLLGRLDSFWMRLIFPKPDLVFYIDCPENIAYSRTKDLDVPDIDYLKKRRDLYLKLASRYNWISIDGSLSTGIISSKIKTEVFEILSI